MKNVVWKKILTKLMIIVAIYPLSNAFSQDHTNAKLQNEISKSIRESRDKSWKDKKEAERKREESWKPWEELMSAIENKDWESAQRLINQDPAQLDRDGLWNSETKTRIPRDGVDESVQFFLERDKIVVPFILLARTLGAPKDVYADAIRLTPRWWGGSWNTGPALHVAAAANNDVFVEAFLEQYPGHVDFRPKAGVSHGTSPLDAAISGFSYDAAKVLVDRGANITTTNDSIGREESVQREYLWAERRFLENVKERLYGDERFPDIVVQTVLKFRDLLSISTDKRTVYPVSEKIPFEEFMCSWSKEQHYQFNSDGTWTYVK